MTGSTDEEIEAGNRKAVRLFASGVSVLTVADHRGTHGTTVSALVAVSRDPLLIGVCLHDRSSFLSRVRDRQWFSVNVLRADQADLARWFADPDRPRGAAQFAGISCHHDRTTGAPLIDDSLSHLTCRLERWVPAGDHVLLVAAVTSGEARFGTPLLSFAGVLHDEFLSTEGLAR